jgi:short-subunit dehydrogenase
MPNIVVVGATRGLGNELVKKYASSISNIVYGTARYAPPVRDALNERWIGHVDISTPHAGRTIAFKYEEDDPIDVLIITAGYFATETLDKLDFDKEVEMYKISAIGPIFLIHDLVQKNLLKAGSKVILVSSESGSITLRHEKEGGGNYGHHASKAAENMVGKLLSLDLKDKGIAVGLVHPGFMRTEMTKNVGFDKFWDVGGAVKPEVAAQSLKEWIETFDLSKTGTFWAPRGPA